MTAKQYFEPLGDDCWELPPHYDGRMNVPARIYGNQEIFEAAFGDHSVQQLINVTMLPGIVKYALAMPDIHQGYGFPIGGVAAFDAETGIISPGGVGYDINCGVRMLASRIEADAIAPYLEDLTARIYRNCPSGVGGKGAVHLSEKDINQVLERGAGWARKQGYATDEDVARTESEGCLPGAHADAVPARAKERGRPQLGSLGAGNHFLEIDVVDEVYQPAIADTFGVTEGCVVVQIHCGSRGLGHEVCSQYLRRLQRAPQTYGFHIPDRELVAAPMDSPEGRDYFAAMAAAANYAFTNRQVLAHFVRRSFEEVLAGHIHRWHLHQVYDVTHNIAKIEQHQVEGHTRRLLVHRKGATRAFPPGHAALPDAYRGTGQPVLLPGSMGTYSYVLVGTANAMAATFGSSAHGAGRTMSRRQAKKKVRGHDLRRQLNDQGIVVQAGSMRGLAEEAPLAYKDVNQVVASLEGAGIAQRVARVRPLAVIKG